MRTAALAILAWAMALPAAAFTIEGVTLGDPLPEGLPVLAPIPLPQSDTRGNAPVLNSIDIVPGVGMAAVTVGRDGPVVAILLSHSPRQDGLLGTPDAVATYTPTDSALTFGETTLGTVLAAYGGLDLDPSDPLATHTPTPTYQIKRDAGAPIVVQFGFGQAMGLIGFTACRPALQDGVPECLNAPLSSIYMIDGAYTGPTYMDDAGTVHIVDELHAITDPLMLQ